jgi:predicted acyl esterase
MPEPHASTAAADTSKEVPLIHARNVGVPPRDGAVLRANVFRRVDGAPAPVVLASAPFDEGTSPAERRPHPTRSPLFHSRQPSGAR